MGVGGWLFLVSNPNTCFLLLVALAEMEGRREKEISKAIKTKLYNYGSLQLSTERGRPPWTIK